METLYQELRTNRGVITRRRGVQLLGRREFERRVRTGEFALITRGKYRALGADEAVVAAIRVGGVVGLRTAAVLYGWGVLHRPRKPELLVRRPKRVPPHLRRGVRLRNAIPAPNHVIGYVTEPVRTVLDCAVMLPFTESLAVADSALRSGTVTRRELDEAAQRLPPRFRARALRVVRAADPASANAFESGLRAMALEVDAGFVAQLEVTTHEGTTLHPDVGLKGLRLALEADSYEFHTDRHAHASDCRRYTELTAQGWCVLRFAWDQVMYQQDWVRRQIALVVRRLRSLGRHWLAA